MKRKEFIRAYELWGGLIVSVLKVSKILLTYVDTPSPMSSALYGAQAGLEEASTGNTAEKEFVT